MDSQFSLYNNMTRKKEPFAPADGDTVKMYVCGPTVYDYFHIGNARCFVIFDMLRRYMEYRGMKVKMVQNFTDVDDKIIRRAAKEGITPKEVAEKYIGEYMTDASGLNIRLATVHPRATENIDEIISIVEALIESGHAYVSGGDVYFYTRSFKEYGKLSKQPIEDLESGARIDVSEIKRDPLDFALWKSAKPGEIYWESPWGNGRPGWHIECSAMARKYLGKTIDIHCGGQDLAFPHHENEIAQSECANGCTFSRFWVHNGFINIDNQKMSKSAGNFFTVRDISAKYGYMPIRFFLLSSHYRSPINFSEDIILQAKNALERIYNCINDAKFYLKNNPASCEAADTAAANSYRDKFIEAMDDDFNTADGIAAIFDLVREVNRLVSAGADGSVIAPYYDLLVELVELMGFVSESEENDGEFSEKVEAMIAERAAAKKEKNYARADEIRNELTAMGVTLKDTKEGTTWART